MKTLKNLLYVVLGFFAAIGVLSLGSGRPAQAAPGTSLASLLTRVTTLETEVSALQTANTTLNTQLTALQTKQTADETSITTLQTKQTTDETNIGTLQTNQTTDEKNITALQNKQTADETTLASHTYVLAPFSRTDTLKGDPNEPNGGIEIWLTGANLHIVNGSGFTNGNMADPYNHNGFTFTPNGLGNLIVGYNETRAKAPLPGTDARTGSHNIIVGIENNYTGIGGMVVGIYNEADNLYSSVTGGYSNTASNGASSVTGGQFNTASGFYSSISGGAYISQAHMNGWAAGGTYPKTSIGPGTYHSP